MYRDICWRKKELNMAFLLSGIALLFADRKLKK